MSACGGGGGRTEGEGGQEKEEEEGRDQDGHRPAGHGFESRLHPSWAAGRGEGTEHSPASATRTIVSAETATEPLGPVPGTENPPSPPTAAANVFSDQSPHQ